MTLLTYRDAEFAEAVRQGVYLNHAGVAPAPARVVKAVQDAVAWSARDPQAYFIDGVFQMREAARVKMARMMGVPAEHVAITKNTGHGLSLVADGLMLDAGDNVVSVDCEYPSVVYPWYV